MFYYIRDIVQGFMAVGAEVASNTVGTVHKVATDSAGTTRKVAGDIASTGTKIVGDPVRTFAKVRSDVAGTANKIANDVGGTVKQILFGQDLTSIPNKVLYDGLGTLAKVKGAVTGTVAKVLSDSSSTASKVVKDTISTADKIALGAKTTVLKVRDDTFTTGVHAASRALSSRAADDFLKYATDVFTAADDAAVVDAILQVIQRSLEAMTQSLSGAALLWRAIFTNGTNEDTLGFILNHLYDLLQFLYDLGKPGNVIPRFPAADGAIESNVDEFPGRDNPYNELDLRQEENRHAIIYQVQRVALTLIAALKMGREHVLPSGLGDLEMNVSLRSDFSRDGKPPRPTYVSRLVGFPASPPNEEWLFINGIANEFVWFQHSCDKIRDTFKREVKGIYNRSDGILWDLIECCGEHSAATVKNDLIERTRSSKAAQDILERELRDALWPVDRSAPDKVVMIAHSQGCLLLRLVLQTLVNENPRGSQQRKDMKEKLRVFTFGNPSIDWAVIDGTKQSLGEYTKVTEHFAHKADFVAMLGVVTHRGDQGSGYDDGSVFYSTEGRGHLFGAHYPLGAEAYNDGAQSALFRATYARMATEKPQWPNSNTGALTTVNSEGGIRLLDHMKFDIVEDIPAELEDFIFFSRLGIFEEAHGLFEQNLRPYLGSFPVLAEYADMLLEEDLYADLSQLLTSLDWTRYSEDERNLLGLIKALSEAYVRQGPKEAGKRRVNAGPRLEATLDQAKNWHDKLQNGSHSFSGLKAHTLEIYLSIIVLADINSYGLDRKYYQPPWFSTDSTNRWEGFLKWFKLLNQQNRFWEAQKIFAILIPVLPPETVSKMFRKCCDSFRHCPRTDASAVAELAATNTYLSWVSRRNDLWNRQGTSSQVFDEAMASVLNAEFLLQYLFGGHVALRGRLSYEWHDNLQRLRKQEDLTNSKLSILAVILFELVRDIVQGFMAVGAEVASNTVGTVHKVATDSAGTTRKVAGDIASTGTKIVGDPVRTFAKVRSDVAGTANKIANDVGGTVKQILFGQDLTSIPNKVLYDGLGTLAKVKGDVTGTVAKVLSDSSSTASKVVKDTMSTMDKIALDAETTVLKVRDDTLTTGVHAANYFLNYATNVFTAADDAAVVDAILQVIHRFYEAIAQSLSGAALIWRAIFTNGVNKTSLNFILNHLPELGQFLYDIVKPGSVLGRFPTTDDATGILDAEVPGIDNPYNELDLWLPENRNAVVCQAQRVALTIVAILKMDRGEMSNGLDDVQLNVSLRSDFDANANPQSPTYISALHGGQPSLPNEKWLFINGIANEFFWFQRSCDKIRDTFNREVTGVYNRSDGILWDFIECCGERRDGEPNTLIENTHSSKAAQKALEQELRAALWPAAGKVPDKVVMVAHSQGCLVLRLALQSLVTEIPKGSPQRRIIKERLRIFTFGNPSIDWKVIDGTEQPLSKYAHTTEHFANETDFVAMLGVVMHRDDKGSGYDPNMVFYSKTGKAHLFGAHYSLGVDAYHGGENSQLLKAANGTEIA